jgi:hypothetical protein
MEGVLDLYAKPYRADRPVVCFDELSVQLLADTRAPQPMAPGRAARLDYEYRRQGTANLFVCFEPLAGWRHVDVTARRTNKDFAEQMRALVDEHYPAAPVIAAVLDNLSTHSPAALYQAFAPAGARRLIKRLEFHYMPKHGSWLNMAELEIPSSAGSACIGVFRTEACSNARSSPGKPNAISPPHRRAPNYGGSTLHDPCGQGLGLRPHR